MASTEHLKPPPLVTRPSYASTLDSTDAHYNPPPTGTALDPKSPDYDPLATTKVTSPFYQYAHDSPRQSFAESRTAGTTSRHASKPSLHVDVRDLELGDISPAITQEKRDAAQEHNRQQSWRCWRRRQPQSLTKPKEKNWLQKLPRKQRLAVKIGIAVLIAGIMLAIALGISASLHSGIYGSSKTVGPS